jgi:hypothetical protein
MPGQKVFPRAQVAGPASSAEDRRAFRRYAADLEVSCRTLGSGRADSWPARLRDISAGGIGLILGRRFEAGTLLAVDLVNTASGSPRTLLSRVMHVTAQPEGEWLLGLALLREMGEDELRTWGADVVRSESPDARAWVRFPCEIPGLCTDVWAEEAEPWQARVVNISPGGFGLIAAEAVKEGTHLHVHLPGTDGQDAERLLVRVVHAEQQPDGLWCLGCELTHRLSDQDQSALQAEPDSWPDADWLPEPPRPAPSPAAATRDEPRYALTPAAGTDPDLARVCAAWPALPAHIRAAVMALVAIAR